MADQLNKGDTVSCVMTWLWAWCQEKRLTFVWFG